MNNVKRKQARRWKRHERQEWKKQAYQILLDQKEIPQKEEADA